MTKHVGPAAAPAINALNPGIAASHRLRNRGLGWGGDTNVDLAIRAIHWYLDPKNRESALEICARITKQPKENFGYVFTCADNYRDPNMMPNLEVLQRAIDTQLSVGYLKAKMDVAKLADLSMVKEAGARVNGK